MQSSGRSKYSLLHSDVLLLRLFDRITYQYAEGLAWVLHYYYQGVGRNLILWNLTNFRVSSASIMAMVLPLSLCSFCLRL